MKEFTKKVEEIKTKPDKKYLQILSDYKKIILKPVDLSEETVTLVTKWRNENKKWFLSRITASKEGTKKWIQNIIKNPERLLFIIYDKEKKIGHIGVHNYDEKKNLAEIDSVLKDSSGNHPKLMEKVMLLMFNWMFNDLKLSKIQLRVFSDNTKAINLYERAGMSTIKSVPLKKTITSEGWIWNETKIMNNKETVQRYLSTMEITKKTFDKKYNN